MKVKKMKGIIVEKNNENCVLLQSDGTFRTVKTTADLEIGTVIYINNTVRSVAFYLKKAVPMVAALFIVAFLGVGVYSWTNPVQYINIDINPSVELAVNRYDRIIKMSPLNDDGEKLLESVDFMMKKYEKGINDVIETARDMGYLEENGDVLISISSASRELRLKTQAEIVEKVTEDAEVLVFDSTEHDQSARDGLSPGKSNIIDKVMESGTNLTEEELAAAPVKDLMLRIKENKKMNLELEKEAKQQEKLQKETEKAAQKQKDESNGKNNGDQGNQGKGKNSDNDKPIKENDKTENGKQEGKAEKEDKDSIKKDDKDSVKDDSKSQGNNGIQGQKNRNGGIAEDNNAETSSGNKAGKEPDQAGKSSDKDEAAADRDSNNGNSSGSNGKASENPSQDKKNTVDKNINMNQPADPKNDDSKDDKNDKKEYIEQSKKEKHPPVDEKGSEGGRKDGKATVGNNNADKNSKAGNNNADKSNKAGSKD